MTDVTQILSRIDAGDPAAANELLPLVYHELRKLAAAKLAHEKPGQTLQATALVHEAYLRLIGSDRRAEPEPPTESALRSRPAVGTYDSHGHFFAAAAEAMRRILVENARRKQALKRGGQGQRLDLDEVEIAQPDKPDEVLAVSDALELLEQRDAAAARLVKLRYFSGLTIPQAAEVLGVSARTADRTWAYARAWLFRQIGRELAIDGPRIENQSSSGNSGVEPGTKFA